MSIFLYYVICVDFGNEDQALVDSGPSDQVKTL